MMPKLSPDELSLRAAELYAKKMYRLGMPDRAKASEQFAEKLKQEMAAKSK